jgi:cytochrome c-type biogenesis protein CcmE
MSRKLLAASLAGGAAIIAVAFQFDSKPLYSYRVGDYLLRDLRDREVRVEGALVHGSLCKARRDCGYRFSLTDQFHVTEDAAAPPPESRPTLAVSYDGCVIPDGFGDIPGYDVTITVQGERCQTCHDFEATLLMARCPAKYQGLADGGLHLRAPPIPPCDALKPRM